MAPWLTDFLIALPSLADCESWPSSTGPIIGQLFDEMNCRRATDRSALDNHLRSDLGQSEQPLGELQRQAHAAVACRIAGIGTGVERDAGAVVHLHEGHRRIVVLAAVAELLLVDHRPEAERRRPALLAAGDRGDADEPVF